MIDTSKNLIFIHGENKTAQVEWIHGKEKWYYVKFHGSDQKYRYSCESILWLKDPRGVDISDSRIYIRNKRVYDVEKVLVFVHGYRNYWHVTHKNGYKQILVDGELVIRESCLKDKRSSDVFEYLKAVASTNILGKEEGKSSEGILERHYESIGFIDKDIALASYLNPGRGIKKSKSSKLIFPFGCNASQKKAVVSAFESQISVIQGPPGTGKTQTILNIIANIVERDQTVLVVSNNNSAIANVYEKLNKFGFGFIVAPLGKKENRDLFMANQPQVPVEIKEWKFSRSEERMVKNRLDSTLSKLDKIFSWQEKLAMSKQELQSIELEWKHFCREQQIDEGVLEQPLKSVKSSHFLRLWIQFQEYEAHEKSLSHNFLSKLLGALKWRWMSLVGKYFLKLDMQFEKEKLSTIIPELQRLFYIHRIAELKANIVSLETSLRSYDAKKEAEELNQVSLQLFRDKLFNKYEKKPRTVFPFLFLEDDYESLLEQYPVVLSTTFSSRNCIVGDILFDYLIMDEASQVSVETGVLAMSCAKNAIIVGDTLQLPNVVTKEDRIKLDLIAKEFDIPEGYDCAKNSFLHSICKIVPNVPQTLLREHYRCHPRIINFCNQKFYGGNLLIMTEDSDAPDTLWAVKTSLGNHERNHYNQREIDVIKREVLPVLSDVEDIGIIAPYNAQIEELQQQIPDVESATIHKFQGREKDTIIMSVVDDQITEFSDDPNLLNVAISRAKERFCLVVSGNEQELKGNISELLSYIEYNNFAITESKIHSIFDYLYSHYTQQRLAFIKNHPKISNYDSENLTFALIDKVLTENSEYNHLLPLCHVPLYRIIRDTSLMDEEEKTYFSNYGTHVDFLIINRVSKKPVLAIETDGYLYHNKQTEQYQRDLRKDHILVLYQIPLLRFSTVGSDEKQKLIEALDMALEKTNVS
ncbi:hypothetical protein HQ29_00320 [Porphyromonas canoris]|uniref:AAA domain-containing protein n=1 Tax=Porphyromonas canoris TaxID=36875 RepID=UPI00051D9133|nr:AAA domain-containing protein [Porphyromonas canoris]KGL53852.1 hypothetical protein HQ29_00320 [Porphyromonas canoris]